MLKILRLSDRCGDTAGDPLKGRSPEEGSSLEADQKMSNQGSCPTCKKPGYRPVYETKREILRRLLEAKTNPEIAKELNIAERTVKNYITRLFDDFGVESQFRHSTQGRVRLVYLYHQRKADQ